MNLNRELGVFVVLFVSGCGAEAPNPVGEAKPASPKSAVARTEPDREAVTPRDAESPQLDMPSQSAASRSSANDESMAAARKAFSNLLQAAQSTDPTAWTTAEEAIHALGPAAIPALIEQLNPREELACELAVMCLAQLGPAAEPAAEKLAALVRMKNCSVSIRANAAATLSIWEPFQVEVIPILLELLAARESSVRVTSAIALGQVPASAARSIEPLSGLLKDPDPQVRMAGARALGSLGSAAKPVIAHLERIREDDDDGVRQAVSQSIRLISEPGTSTSETIPTSATK